MFGVNVVHKKPQEFQGDPALFGHFKVQGNERDCPVGTLVQDEDDTENQSGPVKAVVEIIMFEVLEPVELLRYCERGLEHDAFVVPD